MSPDYTASYAEDPQMGRILQWMNRTNDELREENARLTRELAAKKAKPVRSEKACKCAARGPILRRAARAEDEQERLSLALRRILAGDSGHDAQYLAGEALYGIGFQSTTYRYRNQVAHAIARHVVFGECSGVGLDAMTNTYRKVHEREDSGVSI